MLIGTKHFKVNHKDYRITIHNVGVAPEGMAAYYSIPVHNDWNILDFGSSTIHAIAIRNRRLTDKRSHTFDFGFESLVDTDFRSIMQGIKFKLEKKWNDFDERIMLIGGMASEMDAYVKEQYPNSNITIHHNHHRMEGREGQGVIQPVVPKQVQRVANYISRDEGEIINLLG